jgi:tryptophan halogenase
MIKPLDKIVIVGGGSAGWMSAAILSKAFPNREIVVIESPNIPIVGVGESTIAQINDFVQYLGIDEVDFMKFTDASYKMSIKFTDFYEKDAGGFHYPFSTPVLEDTVDGLQDWFYKKALYPDTPVEDFVQCYYSASALFERNKFSTNEFKRFNNYDPMFHVAYHFDATKFGAWLREKYCLPRGVKHISNEVKYVQTGAKGVEYLLMQDDSEITADLFIDCTGFKSLLLGHALSEPFDSYADMLPNNRAWATRVPYKDKEAELEPFTNCTAIGHGWVWNIPLWSRIGTGYVYSDKYIKPEDAKEEFKQHLMSNKVVCPKTREEVDALEFRDVPMRVGIHKRTWVKNVVAIGLSAGFIEPLESNGLFSVHEFLFKLVKSLERPAVTQWDIDVYNASTLHIFRNFAEFVALHYALSIRNDTEYWQANNRRVYSPGLDSLAPQSFQGFNDLQHIKMFTSRAPVNAGITRIAVGMNYPLLDATTVRQREIRDQSDYKEVFAVSFESFEKKKMYWNSLADLEPSLYEYLKNTIYKD